MGRQINISKHSPHLTLGILLGAFVFVQPAYIIPQIEDKQGQNDEKEAEHDSESTVSQSQAIQNSSSQINLEFESYLLDEVTFKEEEDDKVSSADLVIPSIHTAIRILLRKIISPNAP